MDPFYQEPMAIIYNGDALKVLRALPDESIQMCMTSPPFWGLRNYAGGSDIIWGGAEDCEHEWGELLREHHPGQVEQTKWRTAQAAGHGQTAPSGQWCLKCRAWRGQLGLEPTPELYVEHLMEIFREVKRVLKKDGSFYLNIGDTYMSHPANSKNVGGFQGKQMEANPAYRDNIVIGKHFKGMADKCMVCIPERVMFAMLEDGWILRNKLIWRKPNALPGSQKDRFTTSWEYLYFFVKNSTTCLWRNRQTGEWRDKRPTKEENYPWGGMWQNLDSGEFAWKKSGDGNWVRTMPLWMGFDYYFELDNIRVPHKTQSLERYQRQVNFGDKTPDSKYLDTNPYPEPIYREGRNLTPNWFKEMFPEDKDYKDKFDSLFGNYDYPEKPDWRKEAAKKGQLFDQPVAHQGGGNTGLGKHHGSSHDLRAGFDREARGRPLVAPHHRYRGDGWEQQAIEGRQNRGTPRKPPHHAERFRPSDLSGVEETGQTAGFHPKGKNPGDIIQLTKHDEAVGRTGNVAYTDPLHTKDYSPKGKNPGDVLTPRQESIISHFEQKGSGGHYLYGGLESPEGRHNAPKGKNPGDLWSISTKPSSISVCPKCETVFPRLMKVCPHCKLEGIVSHFAPYPEALCIDPIKASTKPGDTVLDPLAGGGTTGVATKRLGRKAILIDCVRAYCVMARYKLQRVEYQPELEM